RARRDRGLEPRRVHAQRVGLDVHQHRPGAQMLHDVDARGEGVGRGHDLVAGPDAQRHEAEVERRRRRVDGDPVPCSRERRDPGLSPPPAPAPEPPRPMTPGTEHPWARPRGLIRDALAMASSQYASRAALLVRGLAAAAALGPHGYGGWNALNLIFDYGAYSP